MSGKDPCVKVFGQKAYQKCRDKLDAEAIAKREAEAEAEDNAPIINPEQKEADDKADISARRESRKWAAVRTAKEALAANQVKIENLETDRNNLVLARDYILDSHEKQRSKGEEISAASLARLDSANLSIEEADANMSAQRKELEAEAAKLEAKKERLEGSRKRATASAKRAKEKAAAIAAKTALAATYDPKDLKGAAGRKRLLAQQQCFLLYNNGFFVRKHKELLDGSAKEYQNDKVTEYPHYNYLADNATAGQMDAGLEHKSPGYYSDITKSTKIILVDDVDEANDSTIINRIKVKKKQEEFDKITPAEYAQLLPKIRLFKINYATGGTSQNAIEFKFNNKINVNDIGAVGKTFESPFKGSIRGDGAGVKSFDWSYLGTDSFTATRDLKATLKLNFQSFGELKKDRESGLKDSAGKPIKYRYLDLVIQPNCKDESNNVVYNPGCYEILAEVGYAFPTEKMIADSAFSTDMQESIRSSVEHLYLVMTDHSFEFEQDGTFSMTINYRARLGSQLGSRKFNVLLPGGGNEGTAPQKTIEVLKKQIADLKETEREDDASDNPTEKTDDKSPAEEKQEELDVYVERQRMRFYNAIYSSLRERRWILGTRIPEADAARYLNYDQKIKDPATGIATDNFVGLPDPLSNPHKIFYDAESAEETWAEMYDTAGTSYGSTKSAGGSAGGQSTKKQASRLDKLKEEYEDGVHRVRFVYLGDIIAVVRDWIMAEDTYAYSDLGLYFDTPINFGGADADRYDPGELLKKPFKGPDVNVTSATATAQLERVRKSFHIILGNIEMTEFTGSEWAVAGASRLVNMAHIPISLDAFLDFMTRKVVAKKRQVYLFSSFINDLITDLVMRNLSTKCFGGLVAGSTVAQISMLEIPSEPDNEPIAGNGGKHSQLWYPMDTVVRPIRGQVRIVLFILIKSVSAPLQCI